MDKVMDKALYYRAIVTLLKNTKAAGVEFAGVTYRRHDNGGGWVAGNSLVHPTAYLGPDVVVAEDAVVHAECRVEGGVVIGNSTLHHGTVVDGSRRGHWLLDAEIGPRGAVHASNILISNPWS